MALFIPPAASTLPPVQVLPPGAAERYHVMQPAPSPMSWKSIAGHAAFITVTFGVSWTAAYLVSERYPASSSLWVQGALAYLSVIIPFFVLLHMVGRLCRRVQRNPLLHALLTTATFLLGVYVLELLLPYVSLGWQVYAFAFAVASIGTFGGMQARRKQHERSEEDVTAA